MKKLLVLLFTLTSISLSAQYRQPCPWNTTATFGGDIEYAPNVYGASALMITKGTRWSFGISVLTKRIIEGKDDSYSGNYLSFMTLSKAQDNNDIYQYQTSYKSLIGWAGSFTIGYRYKKIAPYFGLGLYTQKTEDNIIMHYTRRDNGRNYSFPLQDFSKKTFDSNLKFGIRYHLNSRLYLNTEYNTSVNSMMVGVGLLGWNSINFSK